MKVKAIANVNHNGAWYRAGEVFETDGIGELEGLVVAEQEKNEPAPPDPAPEQQPKKKPSRKKAGE